MLTSLHGRLEGAKHASAGDVLQVRSMLVAAEGFLAMIFLNEAFTGRALQSARPGLPSSILRRPVSRPRDEVRLDAERGASASAAW